ncbi:hypothetical protein UFOVP1288_79 [uncultured Caudovirales phage]|uniref:Uncharacterized protein n=1 Tax=uncultured Caudovirales phage TaxID=2100421 RepID=A0A6J5RRZ0_9CAUD|nr:hypothetical protein UFOVP1195_79 [uncultured Caudovirales phage]CAB4196341.1 hypothetical protein UFOVP1288_79 [uncultured Caudovirales phage]CAB4205240.1 hypothetical protein UFOVP1409_79 [uncultured Caudovirales phage]
MKKTKNGIAKVRKQALKDAKRMNKARLAETSTLNLMLDEMYAEKAPLEVRNALHRFLATPKAILPRPYFQDPVPGKTHTYPTKKIEIAPPTIGEWLDWAVEATDIHPMVSLWLTVYFDQKDTLTGTITYRHLTALSTLLNKHQSALHPVQSV